MTSCVVQAVWTMANAGVDVQSRDNEFRERIVPGVQALPGFLHAIWARSPDGTRSHHTIVFEDRDGADALIAQIESTKHYSAAAGVHLHSLEIMDVIANA